MTKEGYRDRVINLLNRHYASINTPVASEKTQHDPTRRREEVKTSEQRKVAEREIRHGGQGR
jgi:hypothetical protein